MRGGGGREEAIEQEVEARVASRLAAAHQAGEALPDVLRILLELQAQTRRMDDNRRELMDRVLSLTSQTTAEKSAPTARRAPRPRCATCVACTVAPPPGTRRAPCESWRNSAAPSTPAPHSERCRRPIHPPRQWSSFGSLDLHGRGVADTATTSARSGPGRALRIAMRSPRRRMRVTNWKEGQLLPRRRRKRTRSGGCSPSPATGTRTTVTEMATEARARLQ